MISEIPQYGLRAYALFFSRYGISESFKQQELDWIVSQPMRKKIFALLLRNGWIKKVSKAEYRCIAPKSIFSSLLDFKLAEIIKNSKMPYAFTGLSAIEIWSDFSYVQRGIEKSPYFIKVLKGDLEYWKKFFNGYNMPNYVNEGSTIGEYVILIPVNRLDYENREGVNVEPLASSLKEAKVNSMYEYAYNYMTKKYKAK